MPESMWYMIMVMIVTPGCIESAWTGPAIAMYIYPTPENVSPSRGPASVDFRRWRERTAIHGYLRWDPRLWWHHRKYKKWMNTFLISLYYLIHVCSDAAKLDKAIEPKHGQTKVFESSSTSTVQRSLVHQSTCSTEMLSNSFSNSLRPVVRNLWMCLKTASFGSKQKEGDVLMMYFTSFSVNHGDGLNGLRYSYMV